MQRTTVKRLSAVFFILSVMSIPFISGCGSDEDLPMWDISGGWYTYYATTGTPGEQGPELFTFGQSENEISATTELGKVINGTLSASNITYQWVDGSNVTTISTGTISENGTTMSGTWQSSDGRSGTWHSLVNLEPTVSIAGSWNLFQTVTGVSGEQGPDLFTFTQSGNTLSGTASGGETLTGNISRLNMTFFWIGGDGVTRTFTGISNTNANSMLGTWINTNGQSGTWRATRN